MVWPSQRSHFAHGSNSGVHATMLSETSVQVSARARDRGPKIVTALTIRGTRREAARGRVMGGRASCKEQAQHLECLLVCVHSTPALYAIGAWYDDLRQVTDEEVVRLLRKARAGAGALATGLRGIVRAGSCPAAQGSASDPAPRHSIDATPLRSL